jgi:CHAT domain-containing protein
MYDLLVAPVEETLMLYRRLIVVPHGALHYLPFHALYDGTSYLLQRYEMSYLPGASFVRYCVEARSASPYPDASNILVLGHSFAGRLPYAVKEARTVAARLGGRPLLEDDATLGRLKDAASDSRIVHLAAHGEFRADNPLFSGLALEDGWLTTLDLFDMRVRASLVVLSACQTGRTVIAGGDELLGLMRALLYAGAASLVLSLWTVEDRSTALLMETFYDKLSQGWTKRTALQHAQRQLFETLDAAKPGIAFGRYAHPYYWAPFCLVGDAGTL